MGYVRARTVDLVFTAPSMAEFTATTRAPTIDGWLDACELTAGGLDFVPANRERLEALRELIADHLVEWNLTAPEDPDGPPLPLTAESIAAQDIVFQATLIDTWTEQVAVPEAPLGGGSTSGPALLEEIPMDAPTSRAS